MAEDKNSRSGLWLGGLPWWQALICIVLVLLPVYVTKMKDGNPVMLAATTIPSL